MYKLLPYYAAALFLGSLASGWVALKDKPREVLSAEPRVHNFGTVRQQAKVSATFALTNRSGETIIIKHTVPSCACTVSKLSKKKLRPGEVCRLVGNLKVGAARGNVRTYITVFFRRAGLPDDEQVTLEFRGVVKPDYTWQPRRLVFPVEGDSVHTLVLTPTEHLPDLEVTDAYCTRQAFEIRNIARVQASGAWRIEVQFNRDAWSDQQTAARAVIRTNSTRQPDCHVELRVASLK